MEIFDLFQETAELVSHEQNQAVIRLPQALEIGQESNLRLMIHGREVSYLVRADWLKPGEVEMFTCGCTLLEPDHILEIGPERRRSRRTPAVLRVTSSELPGESATTVDLSTTGMLLKTHGAMEVGEWMTLGLECLTLGARVCWCRDLDNDYMVGVIFEGVDEPTRARLEAICAGRAVEVDEH